MKKEVLFLAMIAVLMVFVLTACNETVTGKATLPGQNVEDIYGDIGDINLKNGSNTTNATHYECVKELCTKVAGSGLDQCKYDYECIHNAEGNTTNCTDTDGGFVITQKGSIICGGSTVATDVCAGTQSKWVHEHSTNGETWDMTSVYCPNEGYTDCYDGKCRIPTTPKHKACVGTQCIDVVSSYVGQPNECDSNTQCIVNQTHKVCSGVNCVTVQGAGVDECTSNAECQANTTVSCGDTIYGDTVLTEDLFCQENGVEIGASGITLDCAGHSIYSSDGNIGIFINSRDNVTVKNCYIYGFGYGINVIGFFNDIFNNKVVYCNRGITVSGTNSGNNMIHENTLNQTPLWLIETSDNQVYDNIIKPYTSGHNCIYLNRAPSNTIWNNVLGETTSNASAYEDAYSNGNSWDFGGVGNYWEDFVSNPGYPNTYIIPGPGDGIDHYPIWSFGTDLFVQMLSLEPEHPVLNQNVTLYYRIGNYGPAGGVADWYLAISKPISGYDPQSHSSSFFDVGETYESTFSIGTDEGEGWYGLNISILPRNTSDPQMGNNYLNVGFYAILGNCSDYNGHICSTKQICSGTWIPAGDTDRCCSGVCKKKPWWQAMAFWLP